jgi:hypothetical protein
LMAIEPFPVNLWQTPRGRQNLPGGWLTAG